MTPFGPGCRYNPGVGRRRRGFRLSFPPVQYGGFFVQEENAAVDTDPFTSEGIYVF